MLFAPFYEMDCGNNKNQMKAIIYLVFDILFLMYYGIVIMHLSIIELILFHQQLDIMNFDEVYKNRTGDQYMLISKRQLQ
jgi:hypothetical protein